MYGVLQPGLAGAPFGGPGTTTLAGAGGALDAAEGAASGGLVIATVDEAATSSAAELDEAAEASRTGSAAPTGAR